jgi:hypothetical protein
MSNFAELVEGIQHKINDNGAQTQDDAWFRTVFLPTIGRYVEAQVKPLRKRIEELENIQREFKYCGVWNDGTYRNGNFVTHDGSVWHCNCDTSVKPGTDSVVWTLAVKRGKDYAPRLPTKVGPRPQPVERRT